MMKRKVLVLLGGLLLVGSMFCGKPVTAHASISILEQAKPHLTDCGSGYRGYESTLAENGLDGISGIAMNATNFFFRLVGSPYADSDMSLIHD